MPFTSQPAAFNQSAALPRQPPCEIGQGLIKFPRAFDKGVVLAGHHYHLLAGKAERLVVCGAYHLVVEARQYQHGHGQLVGCQG